MKSRPRHQASEASTLRITDEGRSRPPSTKVMLPGDHPDRHCLELWFVVN